jgi:hypothetical protein
MLYSLYQSLLQVVSELFLGHEVEEIFLFEIFDGKKPAEFESIYNTFYAKFKETNHIFEIL